MPPVTSLPNTIAATKPAIHRASSGHYYSALPDQATANKYASLHDIIISNPTKYHPFADGMVSSTGNPKIILGDYDKSIQSDAAVNFPENWYAHSSTTLSPATRIPVGFSSKYTEMQPDHASATYTDSRGFTATTWKEWVSRDHWNNVASFNAGTTNKPINTIYFDSMDETDGNRISWQDGHAYTDLEWRRLTWSIGDFAKNIRPAAGMWVGGNALKGGNFYMGTSTDPSTPNGASSEVPPHLDWALSEDFVRGNYDSVTVFPTNAALEKEINMVKSMKIRGIMGWFVVNIQNTAANPGHAPITVTAAQAQQWRRFTMAAYLLGNDGSAVYEFVENNQTVLPWNEDHPWYHVILGLPLDNKANAAAYLNATTNLYTRNYELGTVYLNNTGAAITFNPGTSFTQVDGTAVSGTVTIPAHDALVLMHPLGPGGGGSGGSTGAKKKPPQGTFARNAVTIDPTYLAAGAFNGLACLVNWSNLQDTNTTTLSGSDLAVIDNAIAYCRANSLQMVLRIMCGYNAPAWLKTLTGVFNQVDVQNYNNGDHTVYTIPKFWTTNYINAYDSLMKLLAARYDTTDVLAGVIISGGGTIFAEPTSRQVGVGGNRAEMVGGGAGWNPDGTVGANIAVPGAGYSDAANQAALHAFIDSAAKYWLNVNLLHSFNPYQQLLSQAESGIVYSGNNQVFLNQDDSTLSNTESLISYFKTALGDRGTIENNSARQSFFTYDATGAPSGIANPTVGYGLLYTKIQARGPNIFMQTATSGVVGDIDATVAALTNVMMANAVEMPTDYATQEIAGNPTDWEWTPTNFKKWNQLLLANPITPVGPGVGPGGSYQENLIVHDTFTRVVAAGSLGTTDSGHTYTLASGTTTDFSVDGAEAVINNAIANRSHTAVVNSFARQDMHAKASWSFAEVPTGDVQVFQVWTRVDASAANGYRLRCTMNPTTNTLTMVIQKLVAGATITIGTLKTLTGLVPNANEVYVSELQCTGINPTVLEASFYRQVDGAPPTWMDTIQDSEPTLQVATLSAAWNSFVGSASTNIPVISKTFDFDVWERIAVPVNAAPSLSNPIPADGATLQITSGKTSITHKFTVTATDVDGTVSNVTIQINPLATPVAMTGSGSTYTYTKALPAGVYTITYTAVDDLGASATLTTTLTVLAAPPPPPPPTAPVVVGAPTPVVPKSEFIVLHQRHDGSNIGEVSGTDLRFGKFVMQPGYISYDLDRSHPMAPVGNSEPNATDFSLQRDTTEILSGEIVSRDADSDTNAVSIAGQDWMNYLDSLYLTFDPTNLQSGDNFTRTDVDLKDIAEGLIQKVLNGYNNTLDISMNNDPTGLIQSQHFVATDLNSLKSMLDTLAGQSPGFEWEITHDQEFVMYSPQRTDQSTYRLDSTNIVQIHYGLQGVAASEVYGRGSGSGSAQAIRRATSLATAQVYRDRVQVVDFGTVSSRTMLNQLTRKKVGELAKQKLEFWITIQPRPGENVYASVAPGQYVYIDWDDGFIITQGWYRCGGFEGFISAAGDEQVTYNFNTDDTLVD